MANSMYENIARSPLARGLGYVGRNVAVAPALPITAASDVLNKGLNAANWAVGGDPNYFGTDATAKMLNFAKTGYYGLPQQPKSALPAQSKPATTANTQQPDGLDRTPIDWSKAVADAQKAVTGFGRGALDQWTPEQLEENYQRGMQERLAKQDAIIRANAASEAEYTRGDRERQLLELSKQAGALPQPTWAIANPGAPGAREAIANYNAQMGNIQAQYDGLKQILGYGQEARKQTTEEEKVRQEGGYKTALGRQALATAGRTEAEIPFLGQKYKADIGESLAREGLTKAQAELYSAQAKSQPALAAARVGQAKADQLKAMQSKSKDNPVLGAILKQAETGMLTLPAIMKLRQTYPEYADDLDALALMQVQN